MGNLEAGLQSMQPVFFSRFGSEATEEEKNKAVAQNENNMNQNFQTLFQELEAMKEFLSSL